MFVGVGVLDQLALALGLGEMVVHHQRAAGDFLKRSAFDIARSKRAIERLRLRAAHRHHLLCFERGAVERAPGRGLAAFFHPFGAEHRLASDVECDVVAHLRAVLADKTVQPAEMIEVPVTQDQPVDFRRLDVEQIEIAVDDLRRVTEVEHVLRLGAVMLRSKVKRQAPLAGKGGFGAADDAPDMLDLYMRV